MSDIDPEKLEEAIKLADELLELDRIVFAADLRVLCDAARAHLATLPRFKEVEVWRVEWASAAGLPNIEQFMTEREARRSADERASLGRTCISVTGPHKQRVPA